MEATLANTMSHLPKPTHKIALIKHLESLLGDTASNLKASGNLPKHTDVRKSTLSSQIKNERRTQTELYLATLLLQRQLKRNDITTLRDSDLQYAIRQLQSEIQQINQKANIRRESNRNPNEDALRKLEAIRTQLQIDAHHKEMLVHLPIMRQEIQELRMSIELRAEEWNSKH
jgi:hypothetical protein